MKTTLKPIALDERSLNVTVLHRALKALGRPVSAEEFSKGEAGPDTYKKIRELQGAFNVPVDDSVLVDEATVTAISTALKEKGLVEGSQSFTVKGKVVSGNGRTVKRQRLLAFDLDLRGVRVFREIDNLDALKTNDGFEYLGEDRSDSKGRYTITFYEWQYRSAERKKADVVVFAVEDEKILGRSKMVQCSDYSDTGLVDELEVKITAPGDRSEYDILMGKLTAFLNENKTTFSEIITSGDQLKFTAAELDIAPAHLFIAARAQLLSGEDLPQGIHEILYGIGRRNIRLTWKSLFKKQQEEVTRAIKESADLNIIGSKSNKEITAFLKLVGKMSMEDMLDDKGGSRVNSLNAMLSNALSEKSQRQSFVDALRTFTGSDYKTFWSEHLPARPEFKKDPSLISRILLAQQCTLLTGNNQALVKELFEGRKIGSIDTLMDMDRKEWAQIIKKTGVPDFIKGDDEKERIDAYAGFMRGMLDATFSTRRILRMIEKDGVFIEKTRVAKQVAGFLEKNEQFDFAESRIHDFEEEIKASAGKDFDDVRTELLKIQRVFQISATPEAMAVLIEKKLHSAHAVAAIPQKSFVSTYAEALGGKANAFAIHQRASHVNTRSELYAMRMMEISHNATPAYAMDEMTYQAAVAAMENKIPNYSELFGSPDICECEQCRSVYSAAAYFVDLLRFLWRGQPNADGKTPLDILSERRPDLIHLPLTCENTNTLIPYMDLANEVMEYYTANNSLTGFTGYDTKDVTPDELRASPQNLNPDAYRVLKDGKYPFNLPYHQPLDVIRTYSNHLNASRYDVLKAMNPEPDAAAERAIAAESVGLSHEEYLIITQQAFDGSADGTALHEYFGYTSAADLDQMSDVREFLSRSGMAYADLVALIQSRFVNPHQATLVFLDRFLSYSSSDPGTLYAKLERIEAGTLSPAADADLSAALFKYNNDNDISITANDFAGWVTRHLGEFRQVITLYEPESKCALESTWLRTMQSIYENEADSGISPVIWSKIHRFVRLWKKLGWTIHEVDLVLDALGETDITPETIAKLEFVFLLKEKTGRPLNTIAVLWGAMDTCGDASLYKKLFLNKAVQQLNSVFEPGPWGGYLEDETVKIVDHQSAVLAAFRITEEELALIAGTSQIIDNGNPRPVDPSADALSVQNLSTLYRYVVLAKSLKIKIVDLCTLIRLFGASPFSVWDIQLESFVQVSPANTFHFFALAMDVKAAGFQSATLDYIFNGVLPADANLGLDPVKTMETVKSIRDDFHTVEQEYPDVPESPHTAESLTAVLSLTFQPHMVDRLMGIIEDTAFFETITDTELDIAIPDTLSAKYGYMKKSGRLTCLGVMTDGERAQLKALPNANGEFQTAIDIVYEAPEVFIGDNFDGVFDNMASAFETLLHRPLPITPATLDEKRHYVYDRFIPVVKRSLRHEAVVRHFAALIGLTGEATELLLAGQLDTLSSQLSLEGFSATYFNDVSWTTAALERTDPTIDFEWGDEAPDAIVPADNFTARWQGYVQAPANGEYTFIVEVQDANDAFLLYLDGTLLLEKTAGALTLKMEAQAQLNGGKMHLVTVAYAETSQDAGIRVSWKTASTAPEPIPAANAFPEKVVDEFAASAALYHRAALFITGFALSEAEMKHFSDYRGDFDTIDFESLLPSHWRRMNGYVTLRNAIPQAQSRLIDVFGLANRTDPAPATDELIDALFLATAWDRSSLDYLVNTSFGLGTDDFKNEIALNRIHEVIKIVSRTGISAGTVSQWGAVENDFDTLNETAQLLKNTVKAKYGEEDWLDLAGQLSDSVRTRSQEALVSHLLVQPAIQHAGVRDADGLFEYFLIDVQMTPPMETSRIVQANAAVQMFVNRCYLNLESDKSTGVEKGVSPNALDKDRWEWMKMYRLWEANRKVLLYPENWLEPEWRRDRSPFFRELESYLVQNDITNGNVEQAFRKYLAGLNEVANLEVCGMTRENYDTGDLKFLHVFGRTHNAPYKFYARKWNEFGKWDAWKPVPVDIRSVEKGDDSGVHMVPIVWKNRLFVFWPEFNEVQEKDIPTNQSFEEMGGDSASTHKARIYWEVKLAWSEYADNAWGQKQVSKENAYIRKTSWHDIKDFSFTGSIGSSNQNLTLTLWSFQYGSHFAFFSLPDIQSQVQVGYPTYVLAPTFQFSDYTSDFMKRKRDDSALDLMDDVYLEKPLTHRLLFQDMAIDGENNLDDPFFYTGDSRTYFVKPVSIGINKGLKSPGSCSPYIPDKFDYVEDHIPVWVGDDTIFNPDDIAWGPMTMGPEHGMNRPMILAGSGNFRGASPAGSPMIAVNSAAAEGETETAANYRITRTNPAYVKESGSISNAFGAGMEMGFVGSVFFRWFDTGLEFHTFYHPFSSRFVTNLNRGGLSRGAKPEGEFPPGLMESNTEIESDEGAVFVDNYNPRFTNGLVRKPADFAARTYYKENVCFDAHGANSMYNWELFFHAPLYIATRLSKNGRYEDAMKWFHFIFDPTTDALPKAGETEISRYWKFKPFKTMPAETIEAWFRNLGPNGNPDVENAIIAQWRETPFDPHLVASSRPLTYMKHVVIKYVENLIEWGDSLFRQFTRESVYEALQLYVIANHILGPRPEFVPRRGNIKAENFASLESKWDDFSNAMVELENLFPYSSEVSVGASSTGPSLLGIGATLYFCIPSNEKLMTYWDTVADRLFKIRHCQDIDGVERTLALFAPPISLDQLLQALSKGMSPGSFLTAMSSPPPIYRFTYLIQRANEFCTEVKILGAALLSVLEKKDIERLVRMRASHETTMLELMTAIKERKVADARAYKERLEAARETAKLKLQHYLDLLEEETDVPNAPAIGDDVNGDSQLPGDTVISPIEPDVDVALVDTGEAGVKLIPREKAEFDKTNDAIDSNNTAAIIDGIGGLMNFIPTFSGNIEPFGVGMTISYGGSNIAGGMSGIARFFTGNATENTSRAALAARWASHIRREQEWAFQANLAAREITEVDKEIVSADIKIQVEKKELENHETSIAHAEEVEQFLANKFTSQELYQWMKEQLFSVYKQSYNLAFEMAKKTEKAYVYELGTQTANFIQYGHWDNSMQGLSAGEKLQLGLRQMEKAYLDGNRRELELTKSVSVAMLNPLALIELRETGVCYLKLPEELFDLDFQGHYFRRIKSVSLTISCITGAYTSVNCSLRLLKNDIRINTAMNGSGNYEHENDEGVWITDTRFRSSIVPVSAIATSDGHDDPGMFEFSFRDERYLPFEGAGAVSEWMIELSTEQEFRQFDYTSISDVILHVNYTARESGGLFRQKAVDYLKDFMANTADLSNQPFLRMISMKHEFSTQWHRFLTPSTESSEQVLVFTLGKERFPFFTHDRTIDIMKLDMFARCSQSGDYHLVMSYTDSLDIVTVSSQISMPENPSYGGLNKATINTGDAGLTLDEADITKEMTLKLKHNSETVYTELTTSPDEVEDIYMVIHYRLA